MTPPGPAGAPLAGLRRPRTNLLDFLTGLAREYGDVVAFRAGRSPACLLSHPDHIEHVLVANSKNYVKPRVIKQMSLLFGNSIMVSEGDFWLRQRRMMQPAFQRQLLASYGGLMASFAERAAASWEDGETRDIHRDMLGLTLAIAVKALFDADVTREAPDVDRALRAVMEHFNGVLTQPIRFPDWAPTPGNRRYRGAVARVEGIIFDLIAQRRGQSGGTGDLLARLLQARDTDGSGMTDRQLRDEALTLYLAGQETTAIALAFCWYLLAKNPDREATLVGELRATLGGRPPIPADLPHLPYTDGVLREALRLYPPVWAITREPVEDDRVGGYLIRRGTLVFLPQWIVHRDPRFFAEPERFAPERWQGDLERRLPRFAYFPFGGGPRICIGREFALLEARLVLATIAQRVHLDLVPGHPVDPLPAMTLRPKAGIKVIVRRRA